MDFNLDNIGEQVTNFSSNTLSSIAEQIGFNPTNFMQKLFLVLIIAGIVFLASKITNKVAKFIVIIVAILLGISIIASVI